MILGDSLGNPKKQERKNKERNTKMNANKTEIYSGYWVGQDGRTYRTVSFWVGVGWTAGFLQYQDDLGNWHFYS